MSSSRSGRSSHGHKKERGAQVRVVFLLASVSTIIMTNRDGHLLFIHQRPIRRMIESLESHSVNTLTELVRIERVAASCDDESDAVAFQGPMTEAWNFYVSSNQFLTELRGLTRNYPFCGDILTDAQTRVRSDPESNRSWNMAWLCLQKIVNE